MPTLNLQVGSGANDGDQVATAWGTAGVILEVGNSFAPGFASYAAARFTGVSGLQGATLNSVYYSTYTAANAGSPVTTVAFDNATAPAMPTDAADHDGRTRTTKITWDGSPTTSQFNASPDLKTSLDDITAGGDPSTILVLHDDDGGAGGDYTRYTSYDGSSSNAPKLDIDYTAADPGDLNVLDGVTSIADGGSIDFGSVDVDDETTKTLTIENLGDLPITLDSAAFSGADAAKFSIAGDSEWDGDADEEVAGGADVDLKIEVDTSEAGTFEATLTITSDDADEGTYEIDLTITVEAAGLGRPNLLLLGVG